MNIYIYTVYIYTVYNEYIWMNEMWRTRLLTPWQWRWSPASSMDLSRRWTALYRILLLISLSPTQKCKCQWKYTWKKVMEGKVNALSSESSVAQELQLKTHLSIKIKHNRHQLDDAGWFNVMVTLNMEAWCHWRSVWRSVTSCCLDTCYCRLYSDL